MDVCYKFSCFHMVDEVYLLSAMNETVPQVRFQSPNEVSNIRPSGKREC